MAQLWAPELALSTDWCVSQGQLGGQQIVQHVDKAIWKGKTAFKDTVWVDRCYKMAQLWAPELALSTDWCFSQGQLGGQQIVQHLD